METHPVVVVGGPPHSGKSHLAFVLSEQLRRRGKAHYLLRCAPDGEGNWSFDIPPEQAKELRTKGSFSDDFFTRLLRVLEKPVMPLLVDFGGNPKERDKALFNCFDHSILVVKSGAELTSNEESLRDKVRERWLGYFYSGQINVIADIDSQLTGNSVIVEREPFKAVLSGLCNDNHKYLYKDPVIKFLLQKLDAIYTVSNDQHAQTAFSRIAFSRIEDQAILLNLPNWISKRNKTGDSHWETIDLVRLVDEEKGKNRRIAAYGSAPMWVYAALSDERRFQLQFTYDARYGWLEILTATKSMFDGSAGDRPIKNTLQNDGKWYTLTANFEGRHLPVFFFTGLHLDEVPDDASLILNGIFPAWMLAGIIRYVSGRLENIALYVTREQKSVVVVSKNKENIGRLV